MPEIKNKMKALKRKIASQYPTGGLVAAVGDLHGYHDAAAASCAVIKSLGLKAIFLGDYVDRGPSSIETIKILQAARRQNPDWVFIKGNHEEMLVDNLKVVLGQSHLLEALGLLGDLSRDEALYEYTQNLSSARADIDFLSSLPHFHEEAGAIFVHGGVSESWGLPIEKIESEELIWTYDIHPRWPGKKLVRGHQQVDFSCETDISISLDTGVWAAGGYLTIGLIDVRSGEQAQRLWGELHISPTGEVTYVD